MVPNDVEVAAPAVHHGGIREPRGRAAALHNKAHLFGVGIARGKPAHNRGGALVRGGGTMMTVMMMMVMMMMMMMMMVMAMMMIVMMMMMMRNHEIAALQTSQQ